jgi:hypothetical protein
MIEIGLPYTTLCFAVGPQLSWDSADNRCFDEHRANMCTLAQWRTAVCKAGVSNPGRSWTPTPMANGSFAAVSGCSFEQITSIGATALLTTTCCLEWPVY